jgi:hypothetical protein
MCLNTADTSQKYVMLVGKYKLYAATRHWDGIKLTTTGSTRHSTLPGPPSTSRSLCHPASCKHFFLSCYCNL